MTDGVANGAPTRVPLPLRASWPAPHVSMQPIDQVLRLLGEVVLYGGGSAAVAFILFQYLGKGWIDARFAERLKAFEHEQAKELQRLKIEVESLLSGALKIQEREFTVLPEAWHKLNEAYSLTAWVVSPMQQYPSVSEMDDDELEEFPASGELRESQRTRVRRADRRSRDKTYQDNIFWHRLNRAKKAVGELQNYTVSHGLFLPPPMKQQFSEMQPLLWNALTSLEVGKQADDYKMQSEAWKELQANAVPLHQAIEKAIELRLHSHAKTNRNA